MKIRRQRSPPVSAPTFSPEERELVKGLHTRHVSLRAALRLSNRPSAEEMLASLREREARAAELVNEAMSSHPSRSSPAIQDEVAHLEDSFARLAQHAGEMLGLLTQVDGVLERMKGTRPERSHADGFSDLPEDTRAHVYEKKAHEAQLHSLVKQVDAVGAQMERLLLGLVREPGAFERVDGWDASHFRVNDRELGALRGLTLPEPDLYERFFGEGIAAYAAFCLALAAQAAAPVVVAAVAGAYSAQKVWTNRQANRPELLEHRQQMKERLQEDVRRLQLHLVEAVSVFSALERAYGTWNDKLLRQDVGPALAELTRLSASFERLEASYERRSREREDTVMRMQDLVDAVKERALLNRAISRLSAASVEAALAAHEGPTEAFFDYLRGRLEE